ncbi:MAG: hypothetical protein ACK5PF_12135 [bacterium]|jgi:hypothetical protein
MELNPLKWFNRQSAEPAVIPAIPAAPSDVAAFDNLMNPTTAQEPMVQTGKVMAVSEYIESRESKEKKPIEEKEVRVKEEIEERIEEKVIQVAVQEVEYGVKRDDKNLELQPAAIRS